MKKLLEMLKALFKKNKVEYEYKKFRQTVEHDVETAVIDIHTTDKGLHTIEFKGEIHPEIFGNKFSTYAITASAKASSWIGDFNNTFEDKLIQVNNYGQATRMYRRRSEIRYITLRVQSLTEQKTFEYELKVEKTNEGEQ